MRIDTDTYPRARHFLRFAASWMDCLALESYPPYPTTHSNPYEISESCETLNQVTNGLICFSNLRTEGWVLQHNGAVAELLHEAIFPLDGCKYDRVY